MKYLTGLSILLIVLASCHKSNKTMESGIYQQWKLSEWDVQGGGIARSYPGPDTTIVLDLASNGSYTVQINGQSYSSGSFRILEATAGGIDEPQINFSNPLKLEPGLELFNNEYYSISGGTLTMRSVLLNPGFSFSFIFKPVHM